MRNVFLMPCICRFLERFLLSMKTVSMRKACVFPICTESVLSCGLVLHFLDVPAHVSLLCKIARWLVFMWLPMLGTVFGSFAFMSCSDLIRAFHPAVLTCFLTQHAATYYCHCNVQFCASPCPPLIPHSLFNIYISCMRHWLLQVAAVGLLFIWPEVVLGLCSGRRTSRAFDHDRTITQRGRYHTRQAQEVNSLLCYKGVVLFFQVKWSSLLAHFLYFSQFQSRQCPGLWKWNNGIMKHLLFFPSWVLQKNRAYLINHYQLCHNHSCTEVHGGEMEKN